MKHASLAVFLMLVVSSILLAQTKGKPASKGRQTTPTPGNAEQSLKVAEHQWTEAFKNRDKDALNRILDDRFVFTDDKGQVFSKTQYVDAAVQAIKVASYSLDDMTVRVFGDAAVVAGRWAGKLTIDGKDASGAFRYTDTFVKRLGRWRAVASQETRMPPPEVTTQSGLKYVDLVIGTGESPKPGQTV